MSFLNRVFVTLAILAPLAWAQERRPGTDADGKWRGKLYCLAVWAERANPEEPKDVAEAFLNSTELAPDRKSTRLNSSHALISYAVFCLKKKKKKKERDDTTIIR